MNEIRLSWNQVNAWRLSQHGLAPRLPLPNFLDAATRPCGIQAQVMSAAEMALGARVAGLSPEHVRAALWHERTLVKTWMMRGTLHLIAARDLPLYVAARKGMAYEFANKWFTAYGLTSVQVERILDTIPNLLSDDPMTRRDLADALADQIGAPALRTLLLGGWGSPFKPSAYCGDLCFGPSRGQNITFVHPGRWIGAWQPVEPQAAMQEILRRYLMAYGPSTPGDFMLWWGCGLRQAQKIFRMLEDDLVNVSVEGWEAQALRSTLEKLQAMETTGSVHLLPLFDAYTLGIGRNIEALLAKSNKSRVYRPQGWISAVVLVDGRPVGTWVYQLRKGSTEVRVSLFAVRVSAVRDAIEAEAAILGSFLNSAIKVIYTEV